MHEAPKRKSLVSGCAGKAASLPGMYIFSIVFGAGFRAQGTFREPSAKRAYQSPIEALDRLDKVLYR